MTESEAEQDSAVYTLHFQAPAHFGEDSSGLEQSIEYLHSDTLFSAICEGWARLYGAAALVNDLLEPSIAYSAGRSDSPPLLITSACIFANDVYYLPRPHLTMTGIDRERLGDNPQLAKAFKNAHFIPAHLWQKWVRGESFVRPAPTMLPILKAYKDAFETWLVPRNYVPRIPAETTPYPCRVVAYKAGCGLYFVARFGNPLIRQRLEGVLTYLQDAGLGGERSSGYGHFTWKPAPHTLTQVVGEAVGQPEGYISLALTTLDKEGITSLREWRYSLARRRGYTTPLQGQGEQLRKKSLLLLSEGATQFNKQPPRGQFFDITPDDTVWRPNYHRVYRNALAFAVPHMVKEIEDGR